jgi:hypothetical protein
VLSAKPDSKRHPAQFRTLRKNVALERHATFLPSSEPSELGDELTWFEKNGAPIVYRLSSRPEARPLGWAVVEGPNCTRYPFMKAGGTSVRPSTTAGHGRPSAQYDEPMSIASLS